LHMPGLRETGVFQGSIVVVFFSQNAS